MDSLHILKSTILKLKKREVNSLISFLSSYRRKKNDEFMKSILLVKLLLKKKNHTSNEIQNILYGKKNYHAFNKLLIRLRHKVREVIILDGHLFSSDYGKRNAAVFEIRKKLLQSEVMLARGITSEFEDLQNKIIKKAKQYEIYDSLVIALQMKQRYLSFRAGSDAYDLLKDEISLYEKSRVANIKTLAIYNKIIAKINFSTSYGEYKKDLEEAIDLIKKNYLPTKSISIGYYYLLLLVDYHQNRSDFSNAQKYLIQLKELVQNNVAVHTRIRLGATTLNIAYNELLIFDFENCFKHSNEAFYHFSDSLINLDVVRETKFYSLFYSNKISEAEKVIEEVYHSSRTTNTPFLYSKRACLFAWLKTFQGEFTRSNELLQDVKEIEKDKEGWNIGVRILTIMNCIEQENYEKADREIGKMKRHFSKISITKNIRKRNLVILEVFLELMKQGYDFKKAYKNQLRSFKLLESNQDEYCWKIKSPELMIFHEWFKSKAENRTYNHVESILTEKKKFLKRTATLTRKKLTA
jgi:hypothetical protein